MTSIGSEGCLRWYEATYNKSVVESFTSAFLKHTVCCSVVRGPSPDSFLFLLLLSTFSMPVIIGVIHRYEIRGVVGRDESKGSGALTCNERMEV